MAAKRPARASLELREAPLSPRYRRKLHHATGHCSRGLSASTITRLKADWWADFQAWQKRDLSTRRFLYIWADGVYFKPRMAEEKQCVLVIVGADEYGHKELLGMTDGFREIGRASCRERV